MTLSEYINVLKQFDPNKRLPVGLGNPRSWRGYYYELAFEPVVDITIGEMLEIAQSCIGKTFIGYNGGEYTMDEHTTIHVDRYSESKDLGLILLIRIMLEQPDLDIKKLIDA